MGVRITSRGRESDLAGGDRRLEYGRGGDVEIGAAAQTVDRPQERGRYPEVSPVVVSLVLEWGRIEPYLIERSLREVDDQVRETELGVVGHRLPEDLDPIPGAHLTN